LNTDADKDAIGRAATQRKAVDAKARCKKKLAVAKVLNINSTYRIYKDKKGAFKQQLDKFFPPTAKLATWELLLLLGWTTALRWAARGEGSVVGPLLAVS
jgi:hypothetical protein